VKCWRGVRIALAFSKFPYSRKVDRLGSVLGRRKALQALQLKDAFKRRSGSDRHPLACSSARHRAPNL